MNAHILVVDDDPDIRSGLGDRLQHFGYTPHLVETAEDGWDYLQQDPPDLILLDLSLPGMDGITFLEKLQKSTKNQNGTVYGQNQTPTTINPPVIVMTAFGTIEKAVSAIKLGAFDFLPKPFDIDHLSLLIRRAFQQTSLHRHVEYLRHEVDSPYSSIIGDSAAIRSAKAFAKQAAETDATVLLLGETGTGKELFARAIHRWSRRTRHPFMVINCAGVPDNLLENELFGHERGAFTGADKLQPGKIEAAEGGTIFLDEIGDMPIALQTRLLRVLQDREFHRIGGIKSIRANVRFLAATNKDLERAAKANTFREDLYFRLNVLSMVIPPLRDRKEDIPHLAAHFVTRHAYTSNKPVMHLSDATLKTLTQYSWPGNIRELDNLLARAVLLNNTPTIAPQLLGAPIQSSPVISADTHPADDLSYHEALDAFSRQLITRALQEADGNKSQAAKRLKIQRTYFARLLKKKNILD